MKTILIGLAFFPAFLHAAAMSLDSTVMEDKDTSGAMLSDPINRDLLKRYDEEVRENPSGYKRRWQRSLVILKHGEYNATTGEDIDTLLLHPLWRTQGERLKGMYLYLQGHVDEAMTLMRQNIRNNVNIVEQTQMLAGIELNRHDTLAALAVHRFAWEQHPDENVYTELLRAYRGYGRPPAKIMEQGRQRFAKNPGVMQALFETYATSGRPADLQQSLALSVRAEGLWPRSVDWKIKHAQTLISLKRFHEAEGVLLEAVDLMDEDPRLEGENGIFRKQVFALLEISRK